MWDTIARMARVRAARSGDSRSSRKRAWIIAILWSLAVLSFSSGHQLQQDEPTPGATASDTSQPSAAPSATVTATLPPATSEQATATVSPTQTFPPTATFIPSETPPAAEALSWFPSNAPSFTSEPPQTGARPSSIELSGAYVSDEVLIRFRRRADGGAITSCLETASATIASEIEELSVYILKVPDGAVAQSLAILLECPITRFAEPNYMAAMADTLPSDSSWNLQYGLLNIRAPQGWDLATGAAAVTIAVLDSGVDLGHPDLAAKIVGGYDFVNDDAVAQDDNGHGTQVAGIAAAMSNNGTGVAGVSWGARVMPVKVLDSAGNGTFAAVAAGITWAADNGAQVINLSLGGNSPSAVLEAAVNYAYGKGVVMVAAAGNTGANVVLYPARYPQVIAVAATDASNTRAGFSNSGPEVALSAPGVSIYSTRLGGTYGSLSGTSMSAPFVSGLAAILRGLPGAGPPDAIAWEMESTALDLGPPGSDALYGFGLIQMDAAIRMALPTESVPKRTGGQGGIGPGVAPRPGISTNTPTPTATPTSTSTQTATPTSTPLAAGHTATTSAFVPDVAEPPQLSAQRDEIRSTFAPPSIASILGDDWEIGAGGVGLVLMGIMLGADRRRKQAHPSRRGGYFRLG
jgi:thermitase